MSDRKKEPSRPRSHTIETEHRFTFEALLHKVGWVYRRLDSPDYGIDGQVEVFDSGDKSGLSFYIQLRATDEKDEEKAKRIKVSPRELDYYLSKTEPVMVVRYVGPSRLMYWQWASTIKKKGKWSQKALAAFPFLGPQQWTDSTPEQIRRSLEAERAVALGKLGRPVGMSLEIVAPPIGISSASLKAELHGLEAKSYHVCRLLLDDESGHLKVKVSAGLLHIALGVNRSYTVDFTAYSNATAKSVAGDIWCIAGFLLGLAGDQSAGSVLIAQAVEQSGLAGTEAFAPDLARALVSVGNLAAASTVLGRFADVVQDINELTPIINKLPHAMLQKSEADAATAVDLCEGVIRRIETRVGAESAAVLNYNLADGLPGAFSEKALTLLDKVEEADAKYALRDYFWRHRAMRLLDLDRLVEAGIAVEKAVELDPSSENRFAAVRVYTSQGRFSEAAKVFEESEPPVLPDRTGVLHGMLAYFLRDKDAGQLLQSVDDTCQYLEGIASGSQEKEEKFAALLLLFLKDPGRPNALLGALTLADSADMQFLGEMAIEFGIGFYDAAFPAMMNDYLEAIGMPSELADMMLEAFRLKLRELETGEIPKEIRVLNSDGTYTRHILKNGEYDPNGVVRGPASGPGGAEG